MSIYEILKMFFPSISLKAIIPLISIFIITIIIANIINIILKKGFKKAEERIEKFAKDRKNTILRERLLGEKTKFSFIRRVIVGFIYLIGIIIIISSVPSLKAFSYSLLAGAGVAAIIIGLALQKSLANILSGFMIAISQPFRVGDRVKFREDYGTIQDITLRHTVLKTWDNRHVIIPNSLINEEVINNYTIADEKILSTVEIGISYDSDIDLARKIMQEEILAHPDFIDHRSEADMLKKDDPVKVRVIECADFSILLKGYYWVETQPKAFASRCDLTESIKKSFDKEGVEIPFPYRTLVYKKDIAKPKKLAKKVKRLHKNKKK